MSTLGTYGAKVGICGLASRVASPVVSVAYRGIHQSPLAMEKYYKITKQARPVDDRKYSVGEPTTGVSVPKVKKQFPEYHYEAMFFKRQNRGLFGGLQRKRSKTCSEAGNKNLRAHLPNIVKAKLWSETLNRVVETKVTTTVLRTITKEGGLDNYLTKEKPARIKTLGLKGWRLRYEVLKQKELEQLPKIERDGKLLQVYYVHNDGTQLVVGKNKLLELLYPLVKKDTYTPLSWTQFRYDHCFLTEGELVEKLKSYNFDFSPISA